MQEQIFKDLEKLGHKFSKIEAELEMPKNYLSRFKNPENKLPEKWINPLLEYILRFTNIKENIPVEMGITEQNEKKVMVDNTISTKAKATIAPPKNNYEKLEALKTVIDKINKDMGDGSVMCMGDVVKKQENVIGTGSIALNEALGIGGLPCGRMVEFYGQESSGKTTLAIHVIAEAQKLGGRCAYVDVEQCFDPEYAERLNVDLNRLEISQPDYGEQALEIADRLIESKHFRVVVIDSVAALIPKKELEGESGDSAMGLQARLMSQACRKMVASVAKTNTILIWINQLRNRIVTMPFQSPWITTGGNALKFFCSVRLDISTIGKLKDGEEIIGNRTKVRVAKNKMASPFKTAEFDIVFGSGIDTVGELIDIAVALNIIQKSGSWFSYQESKLGQGKNSVKEVLDANPDMKVEIENAIKNYSPTSN